ncbi:MAG: PCRF domain-containing protein, partial [Cyclobacteriaceae bacterium]|nr:PCRF domain-containing protein [Cyclobacteriaceae bacterium]
MVRKLEEIKHRFEEIGQLLMQPDSMKDQKKFMQLSKEYRDLEKIVTRFNAYQKILDSLKHAKDVLEREKDPEL